MIDPEDGKRTCYCGSKTDVHPYAGGDRCRVHAPWALDGAPEPGQGRYCLAVCYCGTCLHRRRVLTPTADTIVDIRHKASGKRRSSPADYRDAQRALQEPA